MSHRDTDNDSMDNLLDEKSIDLEKCRKLVRSYIDLVSFVKIKLQISTIKRISNLSYLLSAPVQCRLVLG